MFLRFTTLVVLSRLAWGTSSDTAPELRTLPSSYDASGSEKSHVPVHEARRRDMITDAEASQQQQQQPVVVTTESREHHDRPMDTRTGGDMSVQKESPPVVTRSSGQPSSSRPDRDLLPHTADTYGARRRDAAAAAEATVTTERGGGEEFEQQRGIPPHEPPFSSVESSGPISPEEEEETMPSSTRFNSQDRRSGVHGQPEKETGMQMTTQPPPSEGMPVAPVLEEEQHLDNRANASPGLQDDNAPTHRLASPPLSQQTGREDEQRYEITPPPREHPRNNDMVHPDHHADTMMGGSHRVKAPREPPRRPSLSSDAHTSNEHVSLPPYAASVSTTQHPQEPRELRDVPGSTHLASSTPSLSDKVVVVSEAGIAQTLLRGLDLVRLVSRQLGEMGYTLLAKHGLLSAAWLNAFVGNDSPKGWEVVILAVVTVLCIVVAEYVVRGLLQCCRGKKRRTPDDTVQLLVETVARLEKIVTRESKVAAATQDKILRLSDICTTTATSTERLTTMFEYMTMSVTRLVERSSLIGAGASEIPDDELPDLRGYELDGPGGHHISISRRQTADRHDGLASPPPAGSEMPRHFPQEGGGLFLSSLPSEVPHRPAQWAGETRVTQTRSAQQPQQHPTPLQRPQSVDSSRTLPDQPHPPPMKFEHLRDITPLDTAPPHVVPRPSAQESPMPAQQQQRPLPPQHQSSPHDVPLDMTRSKDDLGELSTSSEAPSQQRWGVPKAMITLTQPPHPATAAAGTAKLTTSPPSRDPVVKPPSAAPSVMSNGTLGQPPPRPPVPSAVVGPPRAMSGEQQQQFLAPKKPSETQTSPQQFPSPQSSYGQTPLTSSSLQRPPPAAAERYPLTHEGQQQQQPLPPTTRRPAPPPLQGLTAPWV